MTYVYVTISDTLTFINLPYPIITNGVSINAIFNSPTDLVYILSDIVVPSAFDSSEKPILGHIPTKANCFHPLVVPAVQQFVIKLQDSKGKPYSVTKAFQIELKFNGTHS